MQLKNEKEFIRYIKHATNEKYPNVNILHNIKRSFMSKGTYEVIVNYFRKIKNIAHLKCINNTYKLYEEFGSGLNLIDINIVMDFVSGNSMIGVYDNLRDSNSRNSIYNSIMGNILQYNPFMIMNGLRRNDFFYSDSKTGDYTFFLRFYLQNMDLIRSQYIIKSINFHIWLSDKYDMIIRKFRIIDQYRLLCGLNSDLICMDVGLHVYKEITFNEYASMINRKYFIICMLRTYKNVYNPNKRKTKNKCPLRQFINSKLFDKHLIRVIGNFISIKSVSISKPIIKSKTRKARILVDSDDSDSN